MGLFSNTFRVSTSAITANSFFTAFGTVMRILNAGLTFGFGYAFGAATFDTGNAQFSALLGGFTYMIILDVAAFGWDAAGRRDGISPEQRAIADGMSSVSMWSSTGISGVQLILTTTLITISTTMRENIGLIALILITVLLAAHFVRLFAYHQLSPEAVDRRIDAELQSTLSYMTRRQKEEMALKVTEHVAGYMLDHMDEMAELEAKKAWDRQLIEMGHGDRVARPQVQSKDDGNAGTAPPPKVEHDDAIIDNELRGNAKAVREQNLNMAAG